MANCPGNQTSDINKGITTLQSHKLKEVRGFDQNGVENGLMILDKSIIQSNRDVSYYLGAVTTNGTEVHYKEDLK
jgi:hypothetical protein